MCIAASSRSRPDPRLQTRPVRLQDRDARRSPALSAARADAAARRVVRAELAQRPASVGRVGVGRRVTGSLAFAQESPQRRHRRLEAKLTQRFRRPRSHASLPLPTLTRMWPRRWITRAASSVPSRLRPQSAGFASSWSGLGVRGDRPHRGRGHGLLGCRADPLAARRRLRGHRGGPPQPAHAAPSRQVRHDRCGCYRPRGPVRPGQRRA
jgi:hypothetical protein